MFPFFGRLQKKIFVNNNGVISFVAELPTYTPEDFPLNHDTPIIAPFWADVDNSNNSGTVWFRTSGQPDMLAKATIEIQTFSAYRSFQASWVFIATWDEVGFYGASADGRNKKNTFQAILVLDVTGQQSFVILNYARIEWTTGANSQGNDYTGLGGSPAQAGFNAGDRIHYYEIEGARNHSVVNLTQTSNVGVPGKWIFRIDSAKIEDACSQFDSGPVTFQPSFVSMMGGESISVIGLCFDSEIPPLRGRLHTQDGNTEELCCFLENVSVKCYLPTLFHTGVVNISLNVDDKGWNYNGQLQIENIVDVSASLTRINPDNWLTGSSVAVTWTTDFFESATSYQLDVLAFRMRNGDPSLKSVYTITHARNDLRTYALDLPTNFDGASIAVVRVTALPSSCNSNDLAGPSIYSDVFPVQHSRVSITQATCRNWLTEQSKLKPLNITGHCPCTLSQAEGDTAEYSADPFCTANSDWALNCRYRSQSAIHCTIPNQRSEDNGTFVCCYDKDTRELLITLEGHGGGTMERYNLAQEAANVTPYFTYMQEEIASYMYCCEFSSNSSLCDLYLQARPLVDCRGYQPPSAAQAAGDPHFVSLDGCPFTFNGVGEYTLLKVKGTQAEVQVRAVPATNIKNQPQNATVFSAVAMRASNSSSVVEIRQGMNGDEKMVSLLTDSQPFYGTAATLQLLEMMVYRNATQNGIVELTIVMEEVGLSVLVQATQDMLNIMVMASSKLKGRLEGLIGNYNGDETDDLTARDGTVLESNATMRDIHHVFGMSWSVSGNDSLFTGVPDTDVTVGSGDDSILDESFTPVFIDEFYGNELPNDTSEICGDNPECLFDYMVTGMKSIALATKMFSERYEERRKDVSQVVRCPYISASTIDNGSRNLSGLQVGASIFVMCDDGFHVSGEYELICQDNGEWSSSPPSCIRVIPDNSLPVTIAVGAAAGGFVMIVVAVIITRVIYKKCSVRKLSPSVAGSDMEQVTELPIMFPISDIPSPVFENSLFISSLHKLSERGSFHIPRPTFVDPNIYTEYF